MPIENVRMICIGQPQFLISTWAIAPYSLQSNTFTVSSRDKQSKCIHTIACSHLHTHTHTLSSLSHFHCAPLYNRDVAGTVSIQLITNCQADNIYALEVYHQAKGNPKVNQANYNGRHKLRKKIKTEQTLFSFFESSVKVAIIEIYDAINNK